MHKYLAIAAVIIIIYIAVYTDWSDCNDHFIGTYGNHCTSCENLSSGQCLDCTNCGYCVGNNDGACTPGNVNGPYDKNLKCKLCKLKTCKDCVDCIALL